MWFQKRNFTTKPYLFISTHSAWHQDICVYHKPAIALGYIALHIIFHQRTTSIQCCTVLQAYHSLTETQSSKFVIK